MTDRPASPLSKDSAPPVRASAAAVDTVPPASGAASGASGQTEQPRSSANAAFPDVVPKATGTGRDTARAETIYDRVFWTAYAANLLLVTGNASTFRFAELVAHLGGTEEQAGAVVGVGMIGALLARLFLGPAIDRYGVRRLWILGDCLFIAGCVGFILCARLDWTLYAARIAFATGLAAMFTCGMVHIQNHVPERRRTEVIGNLGSSGFLSMMLGTQIGDLVFRHAPPGPTRFVVLFSVPAVLALAYLVLVVSLTRNLTHRRPHETPNALILLWRYWPGPVVCVALMIGTSLSVTTVFLTRYSTSKGLPGIGEFFAAYASSAFVFRVLGSRWSHRIGRHRMNLLGLLGHGIGHLLLISVESQTDYVVPAIFCGFGHAMLFPAVVSLVAGAFPVEYRGTGTTLALGLTELGILLSSPVLGRIIDHYGFTAMFVTSASLMFAVAAYYTLRTAGAADPELAFGQSSS
ncbi:MAG: MFS transporter [Planctomycetota bacterium]|nr:MAG: MFS transporter [Planctomycetota bacterium]